MFPAGPVISVYAVSTFALCLAMKMLTRCLLAKMFKSVWKRNIEIIMDCNQLIQCMIVIVPEMWLSVADCIWLVKELVLLEIGNSEIERLNEDTRRSIDTTPIY